MTKARSTKVRERAFYKPVIKFGEDTAIMTAAKREKNDILKTILRIAVPATVTQIINTIYGIVDRIFIGKMPSIGLEALSGIGVCFPILVLITAFSQWIAVGASTMVSIYRGEGNTEKAEEAVGNTLTLSGLTAVLLFAVLQIFMNPILLQFGASSKTILYANMYLKIYLIGVLFQILIQVFSGLLICQGFAKESMIACMISAAANIVLDYFFIIVFQQGIGGAAVASVISQLLGVIILAFFLVKPSSVEKIKIKLSCFRLNYKLSKKIILYGLPSFTMDFTETCIYAVYNRSLQFYGSDLYVAAMTIIQSLMLFIYVFANGLTQAVQPTISYYYGAGDKNEVETASKIGIIAHLMITAVGSILLILTRKITVSIFTTNESVMDIVIHYFPIYLAGWVIFGIQSGVQCFFVGMGRAKYSMLLAVFRKIILLIPLMLLLPSVIGITGVFLAETISDTISVSLSIFLLFVTRKKILESVVKPLDK